MSPNALIPGPSRRQMLSVLAALPLVSGSLLHPEAASAQAASSANPLPSWNDGATKQSILDFVAPAERIATFDNDGTLWVEHPMYTQLVFVLDRVKALAPQHPEWKDTQPFKAALEGDMKTLAEAGEHGLMALLMATHSGMTTDEFQK